jgi:hypothetical protein
LTKCLTSTRTVCLEVCLHRRLGDVDDSLVVGSPGPGRANYPTSRRIVRTTPAASGTATQKTIENEICGT